MDPVEKPATIEETQALMAAGDYVCDRSLATSIFLSLSRGGIASLGMALVLLGLLLNRKLRQRKVQLLFIISVVVILYAVGWFGWGPVFDRFRAIRTAQGEIAELRLDIWKDSTGIIRDFPLFGTGAGSFISIYPTYRSITAGAVADHAHNDYVELLTDSGAAGTFFFFWFLTGVVFRSYRTFLTRKDPFLIHLFSGCLAGVFSLLFHSFTDFNLHIGSNGLYFFFLLGLLVSSSHTRMQQHESSLPGKVRAPVNMLAALAVSLLSLTLAFLGGRMLAGTFSEGVQRTNPAHASPSDISRMRADMQRAVRFDPLEPEYQFLLGSLELLGDQGSAPERFRKAVMLAPANGEYIQAFGIAHQDPVQEETAERLLRLGISRDRTNPLMYIKYASWLRKRGRGDEGLDVFKKAVALEPDNTRSHISRLVLLGYSDAEIRRALPDRARAHIIFGVYLEKTGNTWGLVLRADEWKKLELTAPENLLTVHYHRPEKDYPDVSLWTWDEHLQRAPQQNELYPAGWDDFGPIFQIDLGLYGAYAMLGDFYKQAPGSKDFDDPYDLYARLNYAF